MTNSPTFTQTSTSTSIVPFTGMTGLGGQRRRNLIPVNGVSPSLSLDFSSGILDPRITFTRSTVGTYYLGAFNQNLVTQSETFSGWYTDGATPATSGESNPQNSGNAYGITESATTGNHRFGRTGLTVQPSSYVTTSAYLKAGLRTLVQIYNNQLPNTTVTFELTGSGSFGAIPANALSASITPVGNGWYRCSVTHLSATNGTFSAFLSSCTGTLSSPTNSYAGNASAPAIYAWGVQVTEGSLLTPYIPTTTAAITQGQIASAAIDLPRFEYNPVSGAFRGLLIEGGATNLCLQSAAVRTSPWNVLQLTAAGSSITAPDGTASGTEVVINNGVITGNGYIYQDITAAASTTYTASVYIKIKGTSQNTRIECDAVTSANANVGTFGVTFTHSSETIGAVSATGWTAQSGTLINVGNGWYRVTITATSPATTAKIRWFMYSTSTGNGTDGRYLWGAQIEAQAFASSYIPTTTATVARGLDSAVMTGTNFSSWYNETEGTLLCFHAGRPTSSSGRGAEINNNTNDELHALSSGGGTAQYVCTDNGSTQASIGFTIPDADQKRYAAAYRVNDFGLSVNGNTTLTDLTGNLPTVDRLWIGSSSASASFLQSTISRISYWPTRLPNYQLVSLTTIPSTALAMTAIQAGAKIDLTWTQVSGVQGAIYEVERSTNGGATWSPLTTTFGLAFNDTTVLFPGTYTYRVRANVGGEVTDWSSQVSETTVDVPSAPGSLTVTGATTSSISLSWTDSTGEDFYGIEVSTDGFAPWTLAGTASGNATTFTHTGVPESVRRYYRINGINKAGGGVYSSTVDTWTVPATPTGLTATPISSTQINLAWSDVSTGNTSYKVEYSVDNVMFTDLVTGLSSTATTYSAAGLTPNTLYYFRVIAVNAARISVPSTVASATTQSGALSPSWTLDFSSGSFSGATLTRASSGTYVDSSGYVASASTDVARLTHNSSGSRLGLLIEESRTNSYIRSKDFAAAGWTKTNCSIDATKVTGPDNATSGELQKQTTSNTSKYVFQTLTVGSGTYTQSVYAKAQNLSYITLVVRATANYAHATFDVSAGTVGTVGSSGTGWSAVTGAITAVGNGWYRCELRYTRSSAINEMLFALATSSTPTMTNLGEVFTGANATDGVYLFGAQHEAGSVATSWIETTTAAATRSADLVHVLDSSITSWGDGALVVHFYPPGQAGTLISTDDASTAQVGIKANSTTTACAFWSSGETSTGTIGTGVQKAVHYWNGSTSKFAINGSTPVSNTNNFTIANTDFVTLGAEATESGGVPGTFSQYANCIIRKVEFYSGTLTDANLQTITT